MKHFLNCALLWFAFGITGSASLVADPIPSLTQTLVSVYPISTTTPIITIDRGNNGSASSTLRGNDQSNGFTFSYNGQAAPERGQLHGATLFGSTRPPLF